MVPWAPSTSSFCIRRQSSKTAPKIPGNCPRNSPAAVTTSETRVVQAPLRSRKPLAGARRSARANFGAATLREPPPFVRQAGNLRTGCHPAHRPQPGVRFFEGAAGWRALLLSPVQCQRYEVNLAALRSIERAGAFSPLSHGKSPARSLPGCGIGKGEKFGGEHL